MKLTLRTLAASLLATAVLPSVAFADCDDIGSAQWNDLSAKMSQAFDAGEYETALNYGKALTVICDQSPIANVVISNIYDRLGRADESYNYIRRASEFTQQYNLPQPIVEKIWLRRAEFDLPYKAEVAKLEAELEETKAKLEAEEAAYNSQIEASANLSQTTLSDSYNFYTKQLNTIQWTGTGLAIGGGVLAATGGILLGVFHGKAQDAYSAIGENDRLSLIAPDKKDFNKKDTVVKVSYSILFGGVGLAVAGTVMAVVGHVKLTELEENSTALYLNVAPTSATLEFNF